jgi:hypothetical protein
MNTTIRFQNNIVHGRPNPTVGASNTTVANGMYLRAMSGLVIKGNVFDKIDWWTVLFATGGGFGGPIDGEVSDNTFILLPGVNREVTWDAGTVTSKIIFNNNRVYADDPNTTVAEGGGVKYLRGAKATLTTATGWEANSTWGPTPPLDPCAPVKADLLQAQVDLRTANQTIADRDATIASQAKTISDVHAITA